MPELISLLYSKHSSSGRRLSLANMQEIFLELRAHFTRVVVFADALDECTEWDNLKDILDWLSDQLHSNVSMLVTSRKERHIVDTLSNSIFESIPIENTSVDKDIEIYVKEVLMEPTFAQFPESLKDTIVSKLAAGSKGM